MFEIVETARLNGDAQQGCGHCGAERGPFVELQLLARLRGNEQLGAYYVCQDCVEGLIRDVGFAPKRQVDDLIARAQEAERLNAAYTPQVQAYAKRVAELERQLAEAVGRTESAETVSDRLRAKVAELSQSTGEKARRELLARLDAETEPKTSRRRRAQAAA